MNPAMDFVKFFRVFDLDEILAVGKEKDRACREEVTKLSFEVFPRFCYNKYV